MNPASLQLGGTGDAAKINTNADFGFGTGDFTIDWGNFIQHYNQQHCLI